MVFYGDIYELRKSFEGMSCRSVSCPPTSVFPLLLLGITDALQMPIIVGTGCQHYTRCLFLTSIPLWCQYIPCKFGDVIIVNTVYLTSKFKGKRTVVLSSNP